MSDMVVAAESGLHIHYGSCHCKAVSWKAKMLSKVTIIDCNCSICVKKQNRHIIIPREDFHLIQGEEMLTTYTFNTGVAKHKFCKRCGVQSFYVPRSNPDGIGIMPHCIDSPPLSDATIDRFDGQNHEIALAKNKHILNMSKSKP